MRQSFVANTQGYNAHAEATYLRRYTHSPKALRKIFHEPIQARYAKYNMACLATFRRIPDFYIVRSKKHVPGNARYVIQLTKRTYAYTDSEEAKEFIERFVKLYDSYVSSLTPSRRAQIQHAFPASTLLRDLQKLRNATSAEYGMLRRIIPVTHLRLLAKIGVIKILKVDWAWPKKSFVFLTPF